MDKVVALQLSSIAPLMQKLGPSPSATLFYNIFADALVWSDEVPGSAELVTAGVLDVSHTGVVTPPGDSVPFWNALGLDDFSCLRAVWRYRSSLVLGTPDKNHEEIWIEARRLFPQWAGFEPRRQSRDLESVLRRFQKEAEAEIEGWFDSPEV